MDDLEPDHYCRRAHDAEAVLRNLTLFGQFAVSARTTPLSIPRQCELLPLMAVYDRMRALGRLPWQLRAVAHHRGAVSPVIPMQRSRTAMEAEDRVFNRWPRDRVDNNRGGRS